VLFVWANCVAKKNCTPDMTITLITGLTGEKREREREKYFMYDSVSFGFGLFILFGGIYMCVKTRQDTLMHQAIAAKENKNGDIEQGETDLD
jgi:hypothetical protein